MSAQVLCESDGKVTTITLNRPDVGNRVTNDMVLTVERMIAEAYNSQVIVLRGAGENFCLGRELPRLAPDQRITALDARRLHADPILTLAAAFTRSSVPIVGVVRGRTVGGGCALAGLCDVTIASNDATFQLPEMHHGIPPCLAMAALVKRVPRKALTHFVYSGDPIGAAEALAIGMVSKVVPLAELESSAKSLIEKMLHYAQPAVYAVKQFMRSAPDLDGQAAADLAGNLLANVVSSHR